MLSVAFSAWWVASIRGAALTGSSYYFQEAVLYKGWSLIVVKELGKKTAGRIRGALSRGTERGL